MQKCCRLLPEADLENMGTVDGSIEQTEETEKGGIGSHTMSPVRYILWKMF